MPTNSRSALLLALAAAVLVSPVMAQAPDCTGISGVFPSNADLTGNLHTVRVATGLASPVYITYAPDDNDRLFIVEQGGIIRLLKSGALSNFINISAVVLFSGEQGLLGLAFHPDYQNNRYFFVYHTNASGNNVIARYTRNAVNPDIADVASRVEILAISHPGAANHNGGTIAFSPEDGYLYLATGDGGGACDLGAGNGNAQNLNSNLGKMLRINPSVAAVPPVPAYTTTGNPYDGATPGNNEVWSYGLRNPYRFSFDRITENVYIGDVGQGAWEEVDCRVASSSGGESYGWKYCEGNHCDPNPSCGDFNGPTGTYVPPIREYSLAGAPCAITGGNVYRGCRMAALHGTYFYSDYCATSTHLRTLRTDATCAAGPDIARNADLAPGGGLSIDAIAAFGEDNRGEIYIADHNTGEVYKIVPNLSIMEVSGPNATPVIMGDDWEFEDLEASSDNAVASYKFYRSSNETGPFNCVKQVVCSHGCRWEGGDPATPSLDEVFYYLVTAVGATGETTAGAYSDGTLRVVNTASVCPP